MLRLILSPRWILWHLLTIGAMVTCGLLSAWQWSRAGSAMGSALNVGYGLQWPFFALFFGYIWFRFLRLEVRALRSGGAEERREPEVLAAPLHASPAPEPEDGPSPFTPRPHAPVPVTDETDPELAAYNRMLAALAEHDRATS